MRANRRYMFETLLACGVLAGLMSGMTIAKQIERDHLGQTPGLAQQHGEQ